MEINEYSAFEGSVLNFVNFKGKSLETRYDAFNKWIYSRFENGVLPYAQTWDSERLRNKHNKDYVLNFGTQDYLGLSSNQAIVDSIKESISKNGFHSIASPTLTGRNQLTEKLEQNLAKILGLDQCVLFPTGWMANFGAVAGLVNSKDTIVIDKLAHNCLQIGAKHSTNKIHKFEHNDLKQLEKILADCRKKDDENGLFIITETLFSMDSDSPDIKQMMEIIDRYDGILIIDTAHDLGVLGERGLGLIEQIDLSNRKNVVVSGCFSKAFSTNGGFVAGIKEIRTQMVFTSPTYVFSTGISKIQCATALHSTEIAFGPEGDALRKKLQATINYARKAFMDAGFSLLGKASAIIPVFIGEECFARIMSREAEKQNLMVHLVEYPAVRKGYSIFRFLVNPHHTEAEINRSIEILKYARAVAESSIGN